MNELAIIPPIDDRSPQLTAEGEQLIQAALASSALIGKVSNEIENKIAVESQIQLKQVASLLEKTRVEVTKPALEFQRKVKAFFDSKAVDLKSELMRTGRLTGDYASLQLAKARDAENARKEELSRLEKERKDALAAVASHEEREVVQAHYDERARIESPPVVAPDRAAGQVIKTDLDITISNIWDLARAHPSCVKIEPRNSEIKSLIRAGVKVAGVTWTEVVVAGVRVGRTNAIEV